MDDPQRLETLVAIMDRLRGPDGCPWDRQQDATTLRRFLLEECYEVLDALDRRDAAALCEELGDLLFQIVFLSRLAQEAGQFTIHDVMRAIAEKLVRRHPHVFGTERAETAEQVEAHWERIKRSEARKAPGTGSLLDGVPAALPALSRARLFGERAARVGFDWERPEEILTQVQAEVDELRESLAGGDARRVAEEIGDVLFTVAMLARRREIDAEAALQQANRKFATRFAWIERELSRRGESVEHAGFERLERLWQESKRALAEEGG